MKKLVLVPALLGVVAACAQNSWGIKGGMTLGSALHHLQTVRQFHYPQAGYYLGLLREIPCGVSGETFVVPSLELAQRGYTDQVYTGSQVTGRHKLQVTHTIFSLGLAKKVALGRGGTRLYAALVPYAGYGLGGKEKYLGGAADSTFSLSFGEERRSWKRDTAGKFLRQGNDLVRLDAGAGMSLGVELASGLRLEGSYRLSLRNNLPAGTAENRLRFTGFSVGLTYIITNYY
ncbi:hypothetical protein V9K67_21405 [Paraflavisolibacter sp. H34]|uniref:hypothetical protein n=1 Tax=Huijunlia imazamoxiresistens TaxID=3127457 RepID=UPI003017C82B